MGVQYGPLAVSHTLLAEKGTGEIPLNFNGDFSTQVTLGEKFTHKPLTNDHDQPTGNFPVVETPEVYLQICREIIDNNRSRIQGSFQHTKCGKPNQKSLNIWLFPFIF